MEELKKLIGIILGQIYRTQKKNGIETSASDQHIYGLLNGFEREINEELEGTPTITEEELKNVSQILNNIFIDKEKLDKFTGFYDIEHEFEEVGIDRFKAKIIITYFYINGQFFELIKKMDSDNSPAECRTFELWDWDK